MELSTLFIHIAFAITTCKGFILLQNAPRKVVKILTVNNGGGWGSWHGPQFCADGTYAVGYNMKIEGYQHSGDDTALDAILLRCEGLEGRYGGDIESGEANWGGWVGITRCGSQNGVQDFIVGFQLQVEGSQGSNDDTSANYIKFHCRDFMNSTSPETEMVKPPGHGAWGAYGSWSDSCPQDSAVCGIQARIEPPQGSGDDTGLNDIKLFCCTD